jgi:hypothetical protein
MWRLALFSLLACVSFASVEDGEDSQHNQRVMALMSDWRRNEMHSKLKSLRTVTFVFLGDGPLELITIRRSTLFAL